MPYEIFARVYDEVMDETIYPKWLDFTTRHIPTDKIRLLELACGTGALACELSFSGFDVTGLDLSKDMLTLAVERANAMNADVQFVNGDMRDLSEIGSYEIVTCYSDSLCYMKNRQEMQEVFDSVSQVLEDDGYFLFDVHSTYQMTDVYPDYSYHYSADDFAFMWDSYSGSKKYSIVHELTFFVEDPDNSERFIRQDELHHERTYPLDDYLHMLENANFSKVEVYADFTDDKPNNTTQRWFFVCKK